MYLRIDKYLIADIFRFSGIGLHIRAHVIHVCALSSN